MFYRLGLTSLYLLAISTSVFSKSLNPGLHADISNQRPADAMSSRQLGGGLSALGTLISPLLFLMGMGSFVSMLPQMFQTVLSGVGSNLIQSFTGAGGASGGASSTRLKRDVEEELLGEIEKRLNLALLNYEGHRGV
ncbi:hypothetical protein JTE90_019512 [Oedothorax gibbosus]|uniref:Uncharacterized protein n=1 Tax=Oedothorax gibbosus TaxID=931172 RepID=A0AAV6VHE4_9ARAC|nr:hypothetical protein JTE90_019512 [Oedothorax gibbosus]